MRDQIGSPTYTAHLAEGLVRLVSTEAYGLHHMAAGGPAARWYDFAVEIFDRGGHRLPGDVRHHGGARAPGAPARRARCSARQCDDAIYLPDWQDGLRDYLRERGG